MEFLILALSSFGLGTLHALEPGHGKTVVGAYLVGSKGTSWDAMLLGVVVTLTHTGSIIILGVLSTVAAAYFVPETVQKVLEIVSGLLIVGVGGWMIRVRVRTSQRRGGRLHGHNHGHEHDGMHAHEHDWERPSHSCDAGHGHKYDETHGDEEAYGHSHAPVLKPGEKASLGQLVALGISGGIVPCPAALAVLLLAVSTGNFLRGVSLVVIFSVGMAAVLVAIGILMVHAAKFAMKRAAESRWTRALPIISAAIVLLIGSALTVRAVARL